MGALSKAFPPAGRRPMTAEVRDIKRLLNELTDHNLTEWESDFVFSLLEHITMYDGGFKMSAAQGDWLNRLADKYGLEPA